jgi:arginine deiminase
MLIEGTREESGPLAQALNEEGFALPPLPNLFFTRVNPIFSCISLRRGLKL